MSSKKSYLCYKKVRISGEVVEITDYLDRPVLKGHSPKSSIVRRKSPTQELNHRHFEYLLRKLQDFAINKPSLIRSNFLPGDSFFTFVFDHDKQPQSLDSSWCIKAFRNFLRRMVKGFNDGNSFRHFWVLEFGDKSKWHFHMIATLPYIDHELLNEMWGHGTVSVRRIRDEVDLTRLSTYLVKQRWDRSKSNPLLSVNGQTYSSSRGLTKPTILENEEAEKYLRTNAGALEYDRAKMYENLYRGRVLKSKFKKRIHGNRYRRQKKFTLPPIKTSLTSKKPPIDYAYSITQPKQVHIIRNLFSLTFTPQWKPSCKEIAPPGRGPPLKDFFTHFLHCF